MNHPIMLLALCLLFPAALSAQAVRPASAPASAPARGVRIDEQGVIRWLDNDEEVSLFGANYCLPSACDYRAAGYVGADRKKLIEQDMAHFARMGWDGLRLSFWGDYENSDREGNLVANDHLDLLDYLIFQAGQRGIYMLLSPIVTYSSQWPDAMNVKVDGLSEHFQKSELGTNPQAIAAQANYWKQVLNHVNPYTGRAIKDEPSILFVELINEPWHHSRDVEGSIKYMNALVGAIRSTGCSKITFHNLSQDFGMSVPIEKSDVQGVSFGWYPSGLVSGRTLGGNYLRAVDDYPQMRRLNLPGRARVVYEFDQGDLLSPCMYPAMARTFRSVGAQFAAMFSYDMLATAPYNLGWQTHYLNLVYTPQKAVSAIIAGEAMRRLPRMQSYGTYPANTRFGDFRISYEEDLSELVAADAFMYAGTTQSRPPQPQNLKRIVGYGSSPLVSYEGTGSYFLDKLRDGVWRLEVYPDARLIRDPFAPMSPDRIVARVIDRSWPMRIELPDLGDSFAVQALSQQAPAGQAKSGSFSASPGVFLLSRGGPVDAAALPDHVGFIGMKEYHAPEPQDLPMEVLITAADHCAADQPLRVSARVIDKSAPEQVTLWTRPLVAGRWGFEPHPMEHVRGYDYAATLPAGSLKEGMYEYCVSVRSGGKTQTYPGAVSSGPRDWDFAAGPYRHVMIVPPQAPVRLLAPASDVPMLSCTRSQGHVTVVPGSSDGEPALRLENPPNDRDGRSEPFIASLVIRDRLAARSASLSGAESLSLQVRAKGLAKAQVLHITLMEQDGTSWETTIPLGQQWQDASIPLAELKVSRGALLPQGFPNGMPYRIEPAQGRGGSGDHIRVGQIERLEFSVQQDSGAPVSGPAGAVIESVMMKLQ